ncbi:hypothetical protein JAAARDRAFT_124220 [Jaapia argillacea MUCL 33604]|uniref:Phytocyanin domain-containing protein n=1 Tax=Jaapia argillacea MUCL 33604 TaxID=933084 RepID=A0A067QBH5_9AGAM|nr:hypothetical protein JAAARDRAFT_124220 [Jaapia argillacea MUCL 33604]
MGYGGYGAYSSPVYDAYTSTGYGAYSSPTAAAYSEYTQPATTTSAAYATATYGSGSSNWGGSGYNDCVQQCIASFGAPSSWAPTATGSSMGSYGTGATHTVVVAPTQGVLRYVPFAVNASVGDTIKFMWGANNHTVTKSSSLGVCNRSADALFTSGEQNKSFTFTQVINDTTPTFFYCATTGHCEKGMFGIINPPNAAGSPTTVNSMMSSMTANSSTMAAMWSYANNMTAGNIAASNWGGNIDMTGMEPWAQEALVENVLYMRTFIAANPETITASGEVDLSAAGGNPMMLPQDITQVLANPASSPSVAAAAPAPTASASTAASSPATTMKSAAASVTSSTVAMVFAVGLAAITLL